jgi:hypothetical protein
MAPEQNNRVISPGRWVHWAKSAHRSITRLAAELIELALPFSTFGLRISFVIRSFVVRHSAKTPYSVR